jgi:hypothetical protein
VINRSLTGRIHFKIHYPDLTEDNRVQVWRDFLLTVPPGIMKPNLSEEDITQLAKMPLNGREVCISLPLPLQTKYLTLLIRLKTRSLVHFQYHEKVEKL